MTDHPDLSGAVVDFRLGAESADPIFQRLAHRNLPFVVHTGYATDALAAPVARRFRLFRNRLGLDEIAELPRAVSFYRLSACVRQRT